MQMFFPNTNINVYIFTIQTRDLYITQEYCQGLKNMKKKLYMSVKILETQKKLNKKQLGQNCTNSK